MAPALLCPQPSKPMRRTRRRQRKHFFTEREKLRVIDRVKEGEYIHELAAELQVKMSTIKTWLASENFFRSIVEDSINTSLETSSDEDEPCDQVLPVRRKYLRRFRRPIHLFIQKEDPKRHKSTCSSSEGSSSVGTSTPVKEERADGSRDNELRDLSPIRGCSNEMSKWILNASEMSECVDGDSTGGLTLSISDLIRMEREALREERRRMCVLD